MSSTSVSQSDFLPGMGTWQPDAEGAVFASHDVVKAVTRIRESTQVLQRRSDRAVGIGFGGRLNPLSGDSDDLVWVGTLPPLYPEWLGERSFLYAHGVRFAYVTGEMANGIATTTMVIAAARAGMLGFFGSAGLSPARVEAAIDELEHMLGSAGLPYGLNLIHTPSEPSIEQKIVDLYLRRGVHRVSASAFMGITESVVRYACSGLRLGSDGSVVRQNHVFAKISRPEVARQFMSPAPEQMLRHLVQIGQLSNREAELARYVPIAQDITVEGDSGGHTDNRPLVALFPTILRLRNETIKQFRYPLPIRIGAAGGIGTPASVASAFSLGAAYVVTGTINQATVESGLSLAGRQMLAKADIADIVMAPAADMFELGVKVQVLKRGTLFGSRASRLYQIYSNYSALTDIPKDVREKLESEIFRARLDDVWNETVRFFEQRDPSQVKKARHNPKHQMALVFRWYLGLASRWAIDGDADRIMDYQIWCGPVMGAFNAWTKGSFLEDAENRNVVQIALNLIEGAAVVTRAQQLRTYGVSVPEQAFDVRPRPYTVGAK